MAKNEKIFFTKEGRIFNKSVTTTIEECFSAGPDGARLMSLSVNQNISGTLLFFIQNPGGPNEEFLKITNAINDLNLLGNGEIYPKDKNGNIYINIPPNAKLMAVGTNPFLLRGYYENY